MNQIKLTNLALVRMKKGGQCAPLHPACEWTDVVQARSASKSHAIRTKSRTGKIRSRRIWITSYKSRVCG